MGKGPKRTRVVIIGAAGRDFHDFNVVFKKDPRYEVMAFTQAMGQNMAWKKEDIGPNGFKDRNYPPSLAGRRYPKGVPIWPEDLLEEVIEKYQVDLGVLSYSDLPPEKVRDLALVEEGGRPVSAAAEGAMAALTALGFSFSAADQAVRAALKGNPGLQTEELVRKALEDR